MFEILGITVAGVTVTAGLVLMLAGLPLMLRGNEREPAEHGSDPAVGEKSWRSVVVVPLTFPFSVGGATAAIVISTARRFDSPLDLALISVVCVLAARVIGTENKGRIEPGADADLVLWGDADGNLTPLCTWVGGEVVYQSEEFAKHV